MLSCLWLFQIPDISNMVKERLQEIGFQNLALVSGICQCCMPRSQIKSKVLLWKHYWHPLFLLLNPDALDDSKAALSGCVPTLNRRMTQNLTERSFRFLKNASEVPRLYRRTNKVCRWEQSSIMIIVQGFPTPGLTSTVWWCCLVTPDSAGQFGSWW